MSEVFLKLLLCLVYSSSIGSEIALPGSCSADQIYDSTIMKCSSCPTNSSMVPAANGFSCKCDDSSVPLVPGRCHRCNSTEVVSADGTVCVPRRCQKDKTGGLTCRKCPSDYIQVTQNFDGSPLRESQCVRCARGYRATHNRCERCATCSCAAGNAAVRGACVPKKYLTARPKFEGQLHPDDLLDTVKFEYLCSSGDNTSCHYLAGLCVRGFYSTELGGPCRLWIQPGLNKPTGLPKLAISPADDDGKNLGEIQLSTVSDEILLVVTAFRRDGSMRFYEKVGKIPACFLPKKIRVEKITGKKSHTEECALDLVELKNLFDDDTLAAYIQINGTLRPIPVTLIKPDGSQAQSELWSLRKFRRYFILDRTLSIEKNATKTVNLESLTVRLSVHLDVKRRSSQVNVSVTLEARYAIKPPAGQVVVTKFTVETELPDAHSGMAKDLEISGGVLGALLAIYTVVQVRATLRRGGAYLAAVPAVAGCVADTLYFSALVSTVHAAAVSLASPVPVPLGSTTRVIATYLYCALGLKITKVLWIYWKQCTCDVFFLDWSLYYPSTDGLFPEKWESWRTSVVAKEWRRLQTKRRIPTAYVVTTTLVVLQIITPWLSSLPPDPVYSWVVSAITFWSSAAGLFCARWVLDKLGSPQYQELKDTCASSGVSLIVFQEEFYAHYVHGRVVYKQLSTSGPVTLEASSARKVLLTRFLAAFFERALEGFSWVSRERSLLERLLNAELTPREGAATSSLLYDADDDQPTCVAMTWYGEELSLVTLDALILGVVVMTTGDMMMAGLVTLIINRVTTFVVRQLLSRNKEN